MKGARSFVVWFKSGTVAVALAGLFGLQANPLDSSFSGALDGAVAAIAAQRDGRILIGGGFTRVNGLPRNSLARLEANGGLDSTFNDLAPGQFVSHIVVADSKIYVGAGDGIRRFDVSGELEWHYPMSALSLAVDAQHRVIFGGQFTRVENQHRRNIARLNANGTLDATFAPVIGCCAGESVNALLVSGEQILVGGAFQSVNGTQAVRNIARLRDSGVVDSGFGGTAEKSVLSIVAAADGKFFHASESMLVRHLPGGEIDASFVTVSSGGTLDDYFAAAVVQSDGKVIAGGAFSLGEDTTRSYVQRFHADGARDVSFAVRPNGPVHAVAIAPGGGILIGGSFTRVNGEPRVGLARLVANPAVLAPRLKAWRDQARSLVLSWSGSYTNCVLESSDLNSGSWSPVASASELVNGTRYVTNSMSGTGKLYRLAVRP